MKTKKLALNEITKIVDPIVDMRTNKWFLVSATANGETNCLTAAWGALGNVWEKKTATVYIRPQRHTKKFMDESGRFTMTYFEGHLKEMGYLGSTSGKDVADKIAKSGLHLTTINGMPTYEEGQLVLICRTLYRDSIKSENFLDKAVEKNAYPEKDYSVIYIAEIEEAYLIEK